MILENALQILGMLEEFFTPRNNYNVLSQIHLLYAIALYDLNKPEEAFKRLDLSLEITTTRNLDRTYLELKNKAHRLLIGYVDLKNKNHHIERLIKLTSDGASENGILTKRELEILLLSPYKTNKEVAAKLFIAEKTVKTHITNINKKLNTVSKAEALIRAKELKLID